MLYNQMTQGERLEQCELQHAAVQDKNIYLLASYILAYADFTPTWEKEAFTTVLPEGYALAKAQEMRRHLLKREQATRGASHAKLSMTSSNMAKAVERMLSFNLLDVAHILEAGKTKHYQEVLKLAATLIKDSFCAETGALHSPEGYLPRLRDFPKNAIKQAARAVQAKEKAATVHEVEAPAPATAPRLADFSQLLGKIEEALLGEDSVAKSNFAYELAIITGIIPVTQGLHSANKSTVVKAFLAALKASQTDVKAA
jgi:hypothetical protein